MELEKWAKDFKQAHKCGTCPFVKNDADVGVGIIYDCDHVCMMEVDEIINCAKDFEGDMQ